MAKEIEKLNKIYDNIITDWIQDYKNFNDKAMKEKIIEKTKIIAKHRGDKTLVEIIIQRLGN